MFKHRGWEYRCYLLLCCFTALHDNKSPCFSVSGSVSGVSLSTLARILLIVSHKYQVSGSLQLKLKEIEEHHVQAESAVCPLPSLVVRHLWLPWWVQLSS